MKRFSSCPLQALQVHEAFQLFDFDCQKSTLTDFYSRSIDSMDSEERLSDRH